MFWNLEGNIMNCAYCSKPATTEDAMGIPTCKAHEHEADSYYERQTGRSPNADPHLYCDKHGDLWQSDCPRCEECSQFHYGMSVREKFDDDSSLKQRSKHLRVYTGKFEPPPERN